MNAKFHWHYISVWSIGVSHLSGVSVSICIILWSETDQPSYLHVNICQKVRKRYTNVVLNETHVLAC